MAVAESCCGPCILCPSPFDDDIIYEVSLILLFRTLSLHFMLLTFMDLGLTASDF